MVYYMELVFMVYGLTPLSTIFLLYRGGTMELILNHT